MKRSWKGYALPGALALAIVLGLSGCACGPGCEVVLPTTPPIDPCRAEWRCGADDYVALCPSSPADVATTCSCQKNGQEVSTFTNTPRDWCSADYIEKASVVDSACRWSL